MRVTGIELSSDNANVFSFGLNAVSMTDKYLAKTIIGLDADEVVHKFYGFGSRTGSKFYNFSLTKREIVMRIVLNPNYSINESYSDIRDEMYRAISSSRGGLITLLMTAGGAAVATISGFITKFEVPYFSNIPELQITLRCDDPMLRAFNPIIMDVNDLSNSNPILVSDSLSTAPHGLALKCTFTAQTNTFVIQDQAADPDWVFTVTPLVPFPVGSSLYLSSEFGNKYLYVIAGGVTTYLMDRITPGSIWPVVFPGGNEFHFAQIANFTWDNITHYPAYWGV